MSVDTSAERIAKTAGNSVLLDFDFAFKIFAATDITCYKVSAAGVYTLGVLNGSGATGYTVAFDTEEETGTVSWVTAPVTDGFSVILGDVLPCTQTSAFPREGVTPAATQKNAYDKLTLLVQQVKDFLERVPRQPLTPVNANNPITISTPATRKALIYEITGSDIAIVPSVYDPDTQVAAAAASAAAAAASATAAAASAALFITTSGTAAARSAAPAVNTLYYATDTGELSYYNVVAARWFTLG